MSKRRYEDLITADRLRSSSQQARELEAEVLSDNARIITSSAFRRLQTKAQVFSLEQNAAVRSRLTHTLEVAMFGGLIAGKVFDGLVERDEISPDMRFAFIKTVENSCLLHDIGNPPFGHLGEFAIQEWFSENLSWISQRWSEVGLFSGDAEDAISADEAKSGFQSFDGNPQGFRIVSRLQWLRDENGLNLTCSLLASMIKYLTYKKGDKSTPFGKKAGFFFTEKEIVQEVWRRLGLKLTANGLPALRHPLAFLMEAADDIAFCLSDIEDAIEKKIVTQEEFFSEVEEVLGKFIPPDGKYKANYSRNAPFIDFRIELTRYLVEEAANLYLKKHSEILSGEIKESLLKQSAGTKNSLDALKSFSSRHIFASTEAINVELSGHRVVYGLFDAFGELLKLSSEEFERLLPDSRTRVAYGAKPLQKRLVSLLANKHLLVYRNAVRKDSERGRSNLEHFHRAHLISDYISGMTDSHALKVYQMLRGITVGGKL